MSWPSCRQIETEDASASYGPCVILRLQSVCIFKYIVSDSRYCTCSKNLWDSVKQQKATSIAIAAIAAAVHAAKQWKFVGFVEKNSLNLFADLP